MTGDIRQSGSVSPGHLATWITTGIVRDAGSSSAPGVASLGVFGLGGTPLTISNTQTAGVPTGQYSQLGLGVSTSAAYLSVLSFNGATPLGFDFLVNGNTALAVDANGFFDFTGGNLFLNSLTLATALAPTSGGLGVAIAPGVGQIPIGNGTIYTPGTLTAGANVTIVNGTTISATGGGGGGGSVTYVQAAGASGTGLSFTGGPITGAGTLVLGGTLSVAHGGTGLSATPSAGQIPVGNGTGYTLGTLTAGSGVSITGGTTIAATGSGGTVTSVQVSGGSTGLTTSGGPVTTAGTITVAGTLSAAHGGTGSSSVPAAGQIAVGNGTVYLPGTLTAGSGVSITGGTTIAATGGGGTVTSVQVSGGSTGLTTSGGPVTTAGTITVAGTLGVGSGGTGSSSVPAAGQIAVGNGTVYLPGTLTPAAGVSITNGTTVGGAIIPRSTITASTSATAVALTDPAGVIQVNVGTITTVLNFSGGTAGQEYRVDIKQGATAQTVTLGTMVAYTSTIGSFTVTATASARDMLKLYNANGTNYVLLGLNQGASV